jgi:hypothetical protein
MVPERRWVRDSNMGAESCGKRARIIARGVATPFLQERLGAAGFLIA